MLTATSYAIIGATIVGANFISGVFGIAGGMILLGVLLVFLDVTTAMLPPGRGRGGRSRAGARSAPGVDAGRAPGVPSDRGPGRGAGARAARPPRQKATSMRPTGSPARFVTIVGACFFASAANASSSRRPRRRSTSSTTSR